MIRKIGFEFVLLVSVYIWCIFWSWLSLKRKIAREQTESNRQKETDHEVTEPLNKNSIYLS
jgi:hypothetical protein